MTITHIRYATPDMLAAQKAVRAHTASLPPFNPPHVVIGDAQPLYPTRSETTTMHSNTVRLAAAPPPVLPTAEEWSAILSAAGATDAAGVLEALKKAAPPATTAEARAMASLTAAERDSMLAAARRMGRSTFTAAQALHFTRYRDAQRAGRGGAR